MTAEEARELLDDIAGDDPLTALREFAHGLTPYRLYACPTAEPVPALIHTPHRRAARGEPARLEDLQRFVPDRLALERRRAIALAGGEGEAAA